MSDTESSSSSSEEEYEEVFNETCAILKFLKPFDFEPEYSDSGEEEELEQQETRTEEATTDRVGTNDWCVCGACKAMQTEAESLCCRDTNEISEEFFEG